MWGREPGGLIGLSILPFDLKTRAVCRKGPTFFFRHGGLPTRWASDTMCFRHDVLPSRGSSEPGFFPAGVWARAWPAASPDCRIDEGPVPDVAETGPSKLEDASGNSSRESPEGEEAGGEGPESSAFDL